MTKAKSGFACVTIDSSKFMESPGKEEKSA